MRTTPSLVVLLERAVLRASLLMVVASIWLGAAQIGSADLGLPTDARVEVARPEPPEGPRALIEEHDCWTALAPPDMTRRIPGHAVVTVGAGPVAYVGTNGVGPALEHVFERRHPHIVVHAFCR
jgi:hypothetical protein